MKRFAFFVEGYTELLFISKFLIEIFTKTELSIQQMQIRGGGKKRATCKILFSDMVTNQTKFNIFIYDCGADNRVKSCILEQRDSLIKSGFERVVGLRDVYPEASESIPKLRKWLLFKIPQKDLKISIILAVMEVETWFLGEDLHFEMIDSNLTRKKLSEIGFDPFSKDMEMVEKPALLLNKIYELANFKYEKSKACLERVTDSLSYENLYLKVSERIPSLKELVEEINKFSKNQKINQNS